MSIKDWPAEQQPREKLLAIGANSLSDAELLAIFLRTGVKGCSAVELAQMLLRDFGSLRQLLAADLQQFSVGKGLGAAKFAQLQASVEMTKRFLSENLKKGQVLDSSNACQHFLTAQLRDEPFEVFACIFLDNQHRVIKYEPIFFGTIDGAAVYPRVVVTKALELRAAAIILAHNHPSGVAEPSHADKQITQRLIAALGLVDIRVLDHFIVGDGEVISFAEMGLL
ncbi:RadC family protein [Algibacillus agarilyticus]|uniref:RadC family protein n=1 Tax=Algibacillus agarilyticus TaxID=2234133 RepID=UPI000DD02365|nr:DNA repair protein RadC [Algibacillus agarilyticus]